MPEFKTEYGLVMDDVLDQLGVKEAYTNGAHFLAMVTDDSTPVQIGTVIHKTMIDVDRHGTKAAAATVVVMEKSAAIEMEEPYRVVLDRPFVYAIVDNASGVPVFLGVQNSMN
jgi:serpin B